MSQTRQRRLAVAISTLAISVAGAGTATAMQRQAAPPPPASAHPPVTRVAGRLGEPATSPGRSMHHRVARSSSATTHRTEVRHRVSRPRTGAPSRTARSTAVAASRARLPRKPQPTGPTGWPALDGAIARIPTYHAGEAIWLVSNRYGHWGTADWYHDTLYISPSVPTARVYDVAVHEWSHELSVLDYAGDVDTATAAMNAAFGGTGLVGAERAADCMARLQGAAWTHYTPCTDQHWRQEAARLLAGSRL